MSVLIKGMEMPDSCHVCVAGYGGCCFVAPPDSDGVCPDHGRADFCPLIPIPPHGRLIDADAAYEQFLNLMDVQGAINPCQLGTILVDAPTIIESEEEDG